MNVLFVCKANVGRSQMAEAFFNKLSKKNVATSAGTHVSENEGKPLHEFVVACMADAGYDLKDKRRKRLTQEMVVAADKIVVMAEKADLPHYLSGSSKTIFWGVEDAKGKSYEFHCKSRDQIRHLVKELVNEICQVRAK